MRTIKLATGVTIMDEWEKDGTGNITATRTEPTGSEEIEEGKRDGTTHSITKTGAEADTTPATSAIPFIRKVNNQGTSMIAMPPQQANNHLMTMTKAGVGAITDMATIAIFEDA